MDSRLFEAARLGKIEELKAILENDPIALERITLLPTPENPLHIATLMEQVEFVKEILRLKPCFAREVNKDGLIPIHIACATGNLELVQVLLKPNPELCLFRDKGGWTSLHFAALRGRVAVVMELLHQCPKAAKEVNFQGDSAFHLAVKNSRVDVLKALLEAVGNEAPELVNAQNGEGHTVAHLAVATKQIQVMRLLDKGMDEAIHNDVPTLEAGCIGVRLKEGEEEHEEEEEESSKSNTTVKTEEKTTQSLETQPEEAIWRTLMTGLDRMAPVVASVIASTTYSAALSPPKTLFKDNMKLDLRCFRRMRFRSSQSFEDLTAPTTTCPSFIFLSFISFNTAGFLTAVLIILLHPNVRLAPLLLSSALVFLTITYVSLTVSMSPNFLTFLVIYGASIIAFLGVLFYVTAFQTVLRWFIRLLLAIKRRINHGTHQGDRGRKGLLCC